MSNGSTSTNAYQIDPLLGAENYSVWKVKMTDILTELGYWEIVDGTSQKPAEKLEDWIKNDRSALSAIRLRVADKMLVYVASAKSLNAAWKSLKDVLEPQGALGIVMARRKLFRAQCEEGTDIGEHIRVMQGYREELIGLGQEITESEFSITLLTSLPESWNSFIGGIDTTNLDSSTKIVSRILEFERRTHLGHERKLSSRRWRNENSAGMFR